MSEQKLYYRTAECTRASEHRPVCSDGAVYIPERRIGIICDGITLENGDGVVDSDRARRFFEYFDGFREAFYKLFTWHYLLDQASHPNSRNSTIAAIQLPSEFGRRATVLSAGSDRVIQVVRDGMNVSLTLLNEKHSAWKELTIRDPQLSKMQNRLRKQNNLPDSVQWFHELKRLVMMLFKANLETMDNILAEECRKFHQQIDLKAQCQHLLLITERLNHLVTLDLSSTPTAVEKDNPSPYSEEVSPGDVFLLATDGVSLDLGDIGTIVQHSPFQEVPKILVEESSKDDDCAVLAIEVSDKPF